MSASHCRAIQVLFVLLLFASATALAQATTFMRMSLAQMSGSARTIVRARCIAAGAIWDSGEIWTRTTFEVAETWRGASGPQLIAVRLLGGTLGNISSRVSGIPRFQPGEEAVLFLEPSANGDFSIVSWQQGTFRIRRNPRTGEEIVTQDTASVAAYNPVSRHFEPSGIRRMSLASFRSLVDAALAANSPAGDSSRKP